jgi:DNA internalization-related competence protein ComEC/Rec2
MKSIKRVSALLLIFAIAIVSVFSIQVFASSNTMKVHYIDVGQGDAVLIESNSKYMLIDAGREKNTVADYLKKQKIKKLDYLILTHPDADHIGGSISIVNNYTIGKIIMPNKSHTSKTYENLLLAIKKKGLKITKPKVGTEYEIGDAEFTIIAPNKTYSDNNNSSIGLKLENGDTSFLFIGDAEEKAINDIIKNKIDISADVLMVGHHGSDSSTTEELIDAVDPDSAVISVGKNNYGHPTDSVLDMLSNHGVDIYRTDESRTIIATSNGKSVAIDADIFEHEAIENDSQIVYVTKTGKKYHRENCSALKNKIETTLDDALSKGLTPCEICNP